MTEQFNTTGDLVKMNVLIAESDTTLQQVIKGLIEIELRPERVVVIDDLLAATALLALTGIQFDLVICSESINELGNPSNDGNGLEYMCQLTHLPIIILADNDIISYQENLHIVPRRIDMPILTKIAIYTLLRDNYLIN